MYYENNALAWAWPTPPNDNDNSKWFQIALACVDDMTPMRLLRTLVYSLFFVLANEESAPKGRCLVSSSWRHLLATTWLPPVLVSAERSSVVCVPVA